MESDSSDSCGSKEGLRVLLATGGTGGHVAPAIALGEAFGDIAPSTRVSFVGPTAGEAGRIVARHGRRLELLDVPPLRGAGLARWVRGTARLPGATLRAAQLLRRLRPDLVIGTGAALSGPLLMLAAAGGKRTVIFEANVELGLTNAWLAPFVDAAAVAWHEALEGVGKRGFLSGCPVRRDVLKVGEVPPPPEPDGHLQLLVLGGSAGSGSLDRTMEEATCGLGALAGRVRVAHQSSVAAQGPLRKAYAKAGLEARVEPFFPDIASEYANSHLVVTRAGGVTLGELAAVGRPSIVVGLPAAGDHQRANAAAWGALGAGLVIDPRDLSGGRLAEALLNLVGAPDHRERMRQAALAQRKPDAARLVVEKCLALWSRA
jgi:UDP-N-acetylglucosamine--N-acetylmuramyl-(pentapeptide) pyrophosphoryl-undecaprenol N-acetylglucosamine transferase